MDAEGGTGEVSRRACISGTDGSACCLPDVLAGNVVLKGLRLINRAYREDIVISSASPIHSEGMGGVIDYVPLSLCKIPLFLIRTGSSLRIYPISSAYLQMIELFDNMSYQQYFTIQFEPVCKITKIILLLYFCHVITCIRTKGMDSCSAWQLLLHAAWLKLMGQNCFKFRD